MSSLLSVKFLNTFLKDNKYFLLINENAATDCNKRTNAPEKSSVIFKI